MRAKKIKLDIPKEEEAENLGFNTYRIQRKDSGYFILKYNIFENQVIAEEIMTEPDILLICMANLEKLIRKENA